MSEVIRVGDHYEITLRGRWNDTYDTTTDHIEDLVLANQYESDESDTVFVKKIEPPVEVFGPGDVIRNRENPDIIIVLDGGGGYTYVGGINRGVHAGPGEFSDRATSTEFEKVDL